MRRFTKLTAGVLVIDTFLLSEQRQIDIRALVRGASNGMIAGPVAASCVYDYISTLRNLEYPTREYLDARDGCHRRSADKVYYLATNCGGIYFKAGQYLGTLDRIVPKPYTLKLR